MENNQDRTEGFNDPSLGGSEGQENTASNGNSDTSQTDSPITAFNEEAVREAMAKVDYQGSDEKVEKASWVSRLMNALASFVFGSPESYGMKPSFYYLPFERAQDQTPDRPGEFNIHWVRDNFYINDFRFRMLNAFALPVSILIFIMVFAVPASIQKIESWNNQRKAENAEEARREANEILTGLGAANIASCEKVLDVYNDFTSDRLTVAFANQKIEKENAELANAGTPMDKYKPMKEMPDTSQLSPKKQAYVVFGERCQGQFYQENQPSNIDEPFKMRTGAPSANTQPTIPSTAY